MRLSDRGPLTSEVHRRIDRGWKAARTAFRDPAPPVAIRLLGISYGIGYLDSQLDGIRDRRGESQEDDET